MAQININLGTPPSGQDGDPVRTAFEKTQSMFTELYKGNEKLAASGIGSSAPIAMPANSDADKLPDIVGIYYFPAGGVNLPTTYCYVLHLTAGTRNRHQIAYDMVSGSSWERNFDAGVTNKAWTKTVKVGDYGLGLTHVTPLADINIAVAGSDQFFSTPQTAGDKPFPYGFLETKAQTNNNFYQVAYEIVNGCRIATRYYVSGAWQAWSIQFGQSNAQVDPASGGLMSSAVVSGWTVEKYLNGNMVYSRNLGNSQTLPANSPTEVSVAIPAGMVGEIYAEINAQPSANSDHYGVIYYYFPSSTSISFSIRNGPVAQVFAMKAVIKGRWK